MEFLKSIVSFVIQSIGRIHWKPKNLLTTDDQQKIRELLIPNYYIILTRRNNHFSTYMISFANFVLTGKFSYWSHVLMNLEDQVKTDDDFLLIEALSTGVQETPFAKVFNVNGAVLLKPKSMTIDKWTSVLDKARTNLGKPYDNLCDLKNDMQVNCVELVRNSLMAEPDYYKNFANFEKMIAKRKNLTPQMFYDCEDFEVVFEVRRK